MTLRVPEQWQDFDDLVPAAAGLAAGNAPAEAIAALVDRLLQSLEDILAPASGERRRPARNASTSPAQRLALLRQRVDELPLPARGVMQRVVDEVTSQLMEIRRLGGALQAAVRESDEARRLAEQRAMTDALTGLLNRHGFGIYARRAYAQACAAGERVLLLFVDIDQMKRINDEGGHEAGDRAIQVAAEALRRSFRAHDLIVRWGGDEFAVLSVGCPMSARHAAARIGSQARRVCAEREVSPVVGLSVGAVQREAADSCSLDELMARADHAMYLCKQGRPGARVAATSGVKPQAPLPLS